MIIWRTTEPQPNSPALLEQIYNALDCCVTMEVFEAIEPQLNEITSATYEFELALQAPILEMELRGVKIDLKAKEEIYFETLRAHDKVQENLATILEDGLGIFNFNPGSWQQKGPLLYETFGLPPVKQKGKITTNRGALEKLSGYFQVETICRHIITIQELRKKLGFLKTGVDSDGRMRTTYNIGGTDTGRLSSSESAFGGGTNLQNIDPEMRRMFIADKGYKLAYIDLEQAEARAVGALVWNLFQDGTYLDFCESGDLHTNVVKMTWKDLPWTGDLKKDKDLAKQKFYRDFNYRDAAKRLGHASNYRGQPPHISKEVRIPVGLVTEFQREYFRTFPGIQRWHEWVRSKLIKDGWITTFMGRQRWFFGRRWDDETVRSAVAFEPQSAIADYLNRGMLDVWKANCCQLLMQVHDAILIQYPEELEDEVVPRVCRLLEIEVPLLHGKVLKIPTEAMVGWNWGYTTNSKKELVNPDGIVPYHGSDPRKRSQESSFLDRRFS
jgi:DNA polymerase-1